MRRTVDIGKHLQGPIGLACGLLEIYPEEIVRPAFDELRVDIGDTATIGRAVALELGRVQRNETGAVLPLHWRATRRPGLFPSMDAELRLRDAGDGSTEVRFVGSYEPPLGALGGLGDSVGGRKLADLALEGFLAEVTHHLEAAMAEHEDAS